MQLTGNRKVSLSQSARKRITRLFLETKAFFSLYRKGCQCRMQQKKEMHVCSSKENNKLAGVTFLAVESTTVSALIYESTMRAGHPCFLVHGREQGNKLLEWGDRPSDWACTWWSEEESGAEYFGRRRIKRKPAARLPHLHAQTI
jgi:hypothetical protein